MSGRQDAEFSRRAFLVGPVTPEGAGAVFDVAGERVVGGRVIFLRVMPVVPQRCHQPIAQRRALFETGVGRAVQGLKDLDGFDG